MRFQTCFRESPCLSWMYLRNAVVHCKVVALSVSIVQKGTRRLSSSQQTRILRLQANTQGYQPWARGKGRKQKTGTLLTCATSHGLWGLLFACYKLCILVLLHISHFIFTEWVKCFEIFLFVYRVKTQRQENHNETQIFFPLKNTKPSPPALLFLGANTKYVKFTFTLDNQSIAAPVF